jgi:hypothetical protein
MPIDSVLTSASNTNVCNAKTHSNYSFNFTSTTTDPSGPSDALKEFCKECADGTIFGTSALDCARYCKNK